MPAAHSWVAPQVEIGGKGGRAGGGRCPPPWGRAIRGRRGGGTAPPRCRAPAAACAGGRCPVRSTAPTADQRPALTSPRVRRWARGVAPATSRRHHRHRRSARGRKEHVGLRSVSRPRRDAWCTCARCARLGGPGGAGGLGTKYRFTRTAEAATAACSSGSIHRGVVRALASRHIASVDVAFALCLPALISRCSSSRSRWARSPK